MKILALDTSTDACSAALLLDDEITERYEVAPQRHTELILPMIESLLTTAKLKLTDLDAIAFACGPGSFTGVRLAVSVAQGLGFGANLPLISISTLQVLAYGVFAELGHSNVLVIQDARMQEVYWGAYKFDSAGVVATVVADSLSKPEHVNLTFADTVWVGVGSGWDVYQDALSQNTNVSKVMSHLYPRAKYVAKLAVAAWHKKMLIAPENAVPQYLRNEVAWK